MVINHAKIEQLGIPCVSIVSRGFVDDAKVSAGAFGLSNPALAVTRHVLTGLDGPLVRQEVDAIVNDIIRGLTESPSEHQEGLEKQRVTIGPKTDVIEFVGRDYRECVKKMYDKFLDWGWSDGFPVIPPEEEAVHDMLGGTKRHPADVVIEELVPGNGLATVKNIAINAVMAGCRPEFLPVVLTAIEAMNDPDIALRVVTMSTGPHAPLFIVNGPVDKKLRINSGMCSLGPAGPERLSFANVVIGRAVRLCLMNIGGAYPGILDLDTIGSPTKFSMVIAENEEANPWEPFHVEKGFRSDQSTVSCCYGQSLTEMCDVQSDKAAGVMNTIARFTRGIAETIYGMDGIIHNAVILMSPDHAAILAREGWTKDDIRQYLYTHCRMPAEEYRRSCCVAPAFPKWIEAADSKAMIPLYRRPEDIQIVVVGGGAGKSQVYLGLCPINPHVIGA